MIKSLLIFTLLIYSCGSGNNHTETKQDSIIHVIGDQSKTNEASKKKPVDSSFLSFWKQFAIAVNTKNYSAFRSMSLDNIKYEENNIEINKFIQIHFSEVFDDSLVNKFTNIEKIDFLTDEIKASDIFSTAIEDKYLIQEVHIDKLYSPDLVIVELKFVKTKNGYRLYKYDRFG